MEVAVQTRLQLPNKLDTGPRQEDKMANNNSNLHNRRQQRPIRDDNIESVAFKMANDIVQYASSNKRPPCCSVYVSTMRRVVDEILIKHEFLFNGMVQKLKLVDVDVHSTCTAIADELFADGKINWGRIVALYAFVGRLSKYFADHGLDADDYSVALASYLSDYVEDHLHTWICQQGGWDKFVAHFPENSNIESKFFKGLVFTGVGLGLLAGAGYLVTR